MYMDHSGYGSQWLRGLNVHGSQWLWITVVTWAECIWITVTMDHSGHVGYMFLHPHPVQGLGCGCWLTKGFQVPSDVS